LFPFDPALREEEQLTRTPVTHSTGAHHQRIEERYSCDAGGSISVEIVNHSSGYSRRYRLAKWAGKSAPVIPGKKKRAARK